MKRTLAALLVLSSCGAPPVKLGNACPCGLIGHRACEEGYPSKAIVACAPTDFNGGNCRWLGDAQCSGTCGQAFDGGPICTP